jgi:hypothetical protein
MILSIYLVGITLSFLANRTILHPLFLFTMFVMPATISAQEDVGILMSIGVLFLNLGGFVYSKLRIKNITKTRNLFIGRKMELGFSSPVIFGLTLKFITFFVILFSFYYYYKVGISLFAEEVGLARLESRHAVSGSYVYQRFFRVFLPIICLIYYLSKFNSQLKNYYKNSYFIILIVMTTLLLSFTGIRGNIILFLFTPFVVLFGLLNDKLKLIPIMQLFLLSLFIGSFITYLMYGTANIFMIMELIIKRLTVGATDGIEYMLLADVPANGHYYISIYLNDVMSIFSKLRLIDGQVQNYSAYMASEMLGDRYNGEAAAVYFMGELYASGGYLLVIFGSMFYGIIIQFIYIKTLLGSKTVIRLASSVFFMGVMVTILGGPTLSMIIDYSITILSLYILTVSIYSIFLALLNKHITSK